MFGRKPRYYFNTRTHEVEVGRQSSWRDRMGPYDSYEDALHALVRARANTARHDALDAEDRGEDVDDPTPSSRGGASRRRGDQ